MMSAIPRTRKTPVPVVVVSSVQHPNYKIIQNRPKKIMFAINGNIVWFLFVLLFDCKEFLVPVELINSIT